jgi:hypothetical protein
MKARIENRSGSVDRRKCGFAKLSVVPFALLSAGSVRSDRAPAAQNSLPPITAAAFFQRILRNKAAEPEAVSGPGRLVLALHPPSTAWLGAILSGAPSLEHLTRRRLLERGRLPERC